MLLTFDDKGEIVIERRNFDTISFRKLTAIAFDFEFERSRAAEGDFYFKLISLVHFLVTNVFFHLWWH